MNLVKGDFSAENYEHHRGKMVVTSKKEVFPSPICLQPTTDCLSISLRNTEKIRPLGESRLLRPSSYLLPRTASPDGGEDLGAVSRR